MKGRIRERERERQSSQISWIHSPNAKSQDYSRLKAGDRNLIQVFLMGRKDPTYLRSHHVLPPRSQVSMTLESGMEPELHSKHSDI